MSARKNTTVDCLQFQILSKSNTKFSQKLVKIKPQKCLTNEKMRKSQIRVRCVDPEILKSQNESKKHLRTKKESERLHL